MLTDLEQLADALGYRFQYGYAKDLNISADELTNYDARLILFCEQPIGGPVGEDDQGAFELAYNLVLWLLTPGSLSGNAPDRIDGLTATRTQALLRLLPNLAKTYTLSNINIVEQVNVDDKNLNGQRITLTAKPKILTSLC